MKTLENTLFIPSESESAAYQALCDQTDYSASYQLADVIWDVFGWDYENGRMVPSQLCARDPWIDFLQVIAPFASGVFRYEDEEGNQYKYEIRHGVVYHYQGEIVWREL